MEEVDLTAAPPRLLAPVTRLALLLEVRELVDRALVGATRVSGFAGAPRVVLVEVTEQLAHTHCRDARRYAQVDPASWCFEFAPATLLLPRRFRRGLVGHEIGHCLAPAEGEDGADQAFGKATGTRIVYDRRWPGKGLQALDE